MSIALNVKNNYLNRFLRASSITGSTNEEISPPMEAISRTNVEDKKELNNRKKGQLGENVIMLLQKYKQELEV